AQCVRREHLETADGPRLGVVGEGHDQRGDPVSPTRQPDGECSAHSLDLTVERELADDREWTDALAGHGAGGGENPKGDGWIERGAFLPEVGSREIHRDPIGRKRKPGVADRRAHALAAFAHRRVREPDRCEGGKAGRYVDLDPHQRSFDADQGCGQDSGEHQELFDRPAARVNVAVSRQWVKPRRTARAGVGGKSPAMARPVILVVDDDPGVRESFRLILEDHYDVVDVPDGPSALDVVRTSPMDLVLLDIRLPGMDGIEVLERIKVIDERVEVILVTAVKTVRTAVAAMKLRPFP